VPHTLTSLPADGQIGWAAPVEWRGVDSKPPDPAGISNANMYHVAPLDDWLPFGSSASGR
jgi:hypothetical protein